MKLAEVLSGPEKWIQIDPPNQMRQLRGKARNAVCLLNAVAQVTGGSSGAALIREQNRMLSLIECADLAEGFRWNDDPARTWDEVARVVAEYDRDRMLNP